MQKLLMCFGLILATATAAQAQQLGVDIQLFVPTPSSTGFLTADSAAVPEHLSFNFGTMLTYGHGLLQVISVQQGGILAPIGPVVNQRIDLNLLGSVGLWGFAEVGLLLPLVYTGGFDSGNFTSNQIDIGTARLPSVTQGDLRLVPKLRVLQAFDGLLDIAVVPTLILPTGRGSSLTSEAKVAFVPALVFSSHMGPVRAALDLGYKLRHSVTLGGSNVTIGGEMFAKLAVAYMPIAHLEVIGEVSGLTQMAHPFGQGVLDINRQAGSPVEADVGVRLSWHSFSFTVGAGGGLTPGYGAPAPRLFLGTTYDTSKTVLPDRDHDGIPDIRDKCPDRPEDHDGFEDEDGCPDPDNDHDHIPDEDDLCPNEPEDKDHFQDEDGCPDLDNDADGIPDALDRCPDVPEDRDGFEDDDGCPDLDNDHDGIPDALDVCPDAPEDFDGFEDQDGCPDLDNDQDGLPDLNDQCPNFPEDLDGVQDDDGCAEDNDHDGIPDNLDKCPNEPETYNGFEDEDGCPDVAKTRSLVQITEDKIEIKETIYFKAGNAVIEARSHTLLNQVAAVLRNFKRISKLRIEGHTDNTGDKQKNVRLSQDRANAVRKYLTDHGIAARRLNAFGIGPQRPIASNKTATGREKNRRVEFIIAEQQQIGEEARPTHAPTLSPEAQPVPVAPPSAAPPTQGTSPTEDLLDLRTVPSPQPDAAVPPADKNRRTPAVKVRPKKTPKARQNKEVQFDF